MAEARTARPSSAALTVYELLCRHAQANENGDGVAQLGRKEIADYCGFSEQSITGMVQRLEENGLLTIEHVTLPPPVGHSANRYIIPKLGWLAELTRQERVSKRSETE